MKKIFLTPFFILFLAGCYSSSSATIDIPSHAEPDEINTSEEVAEINVEVLEEPEKEEEDDEEEYVYYKGIMAESGKFKGQEIEYKFLKELPSSKIITERAFDGCEEKESYQDQNWYSAMETKLTEISKILPYSMLGGYAIDEMCFSLDKKYVIGTYGGEYGKSGFVFRYDIGENLVEVASYIDETRAHLFNSFGSFGKRNGFIIPVTSSGGDAGCGGTTYYDYDLRKNTLKKRKTCSGCWGFADSNGDGKINELDEEIYDEECEEF